MCENYPDKKYLPLKSKTFILVSAPEIKVWQMLKPSSLDVQTISMIMCKISENVSQARGYAYDGVSILNKLGIMLTGQKIIHSLKRCTIL